MWRVAGLRVRSPSPPRATRSYASRLVLQRYFLRPERLSISPVSRFLDGRAKSITLRSKWPARATVHRSFCFPARIDDDSKTVGRAGQSSSPYEIGANSAQVRLRSGEEATARTLERRQRRARKHTADRRSHVSPARRFPAPRFDRAHSRNLPRRGVQGGALRPSKTSRAATGGCGVIRCSACPQPRCRRHRRTTRCASRRRSRTSASSRNA